MDEVVPNVYMCTSILEELKENAIFIWIQKDETSTYTINLILLTREAREITNPSSVNMDMPNDPNIKPVYLLSFSPL